MQTYHVTGIKPLHDGPQGAQPDCTTCEGIGTVKRATPLGFETDPCERCDGSGAEPIHDVETCDDDDPALIGWSIYTEDSDGDPEWLSDHDTRPEAEAEATRLREAALGPANPIAAIFGGTARTYPFPTEHGVSFSEMGIHPGLPEPKNKIKPYQPGGPWTAQDALLAPAPRWTPRKIGLPALAHEAAEALLLIAKGEIVNRGRLRALLKEIERRGWL